MHNNFADRQRCFLPSYQNLFAKILSQILLLEEEANQLGKGLARQLPGEICRGCVALHNTSRPKPEATRESTSK
jgi:hypothetical protein